MTSEPEIRKIFEKAINSNESLLQISAIIRNFKNSGVEQEKIIKVLVTMRNSPQGKFDEVYEDKVLEILDIASGFCSPHLKIW